MIVRRKNPDDNRITLVSLTEEGRNKIQAFQEEKERFAASAFKGLSEEERDNLFKYVKSHSRKYKRIIKRENTTMTNSVKQMILTKF